MIFPKIGFTKLNQLIHDQNDRKPQDCRKKEYQKLSFELKLMIIDKI